MFFSPYRKKKVATLLLACAPVLTLAYVGFLPCPIASLFRVPCPSCGSTRSLQAFIHGDWDTYWRLNPVALPLGIGVAFFFIRFTLMPGGYRVVPRAYTSLVEKLLLGWLAIWVSAQYLLWFSRFFGFFGGPVPV